jgi:hypothetical protein
MPEPPEPELDHGAITVIVTTSPARSDPELDMLRTTFASCPRPPGAVKQP